MKEAAAINRIVTIAKVIPILVFVALSLFALDPEVFANNWSGNSDVGNLFEQVSGTMLVTVFVFLGVEGASVYSRHAQRREDVGRATIVGFLCVFSVFASVTIVSYGILPYSEIADLRQPSMGGVLEAAYGQWGMVFVSLGLIVSVLGAYLAWTLMAAEVLFVAAKDDDMPRFLTTFDPATDVPGRALLMSTLLVQLMLVVVMFSENAFNFALDLTSALTLIPFLLAAAYALKLAVTRETTRREPRGTQAPAAGGRSRDALHRVPAVCGRYQVHPALLCHLRPRHDPVRHGPARAGQAALLAPRAGHPRRLGCRRDRRRRRPWPSAGSPSDPR